MNAMDIEKTMEFILSTQARVEASIEKLEASARGHEERITKLEASIATVTDLVGRLAQTEIRLVEGVERRADRREAGFGKVRAIRANRKHKPNPQIKFFKKLP